MRKLNLFARRRPSLLVLAAERAVRAAALLLVVAAGAFLLSMLRLKARHVALVQRRVLRRIIRRNAKTSIGADLGFATIRSLGDYRARKPITGYEFFRPYVDESLRTGTNLLSNDAITGFTSTSGTTAEPKRFLLTQRALRQERRREVILSLFAIFRRRPSLIFAPVLLMIAGEERSRHGRSTHKAAANALFRDNLFGRFSAVPPCLYEVADCEAKYYYFALLALGCRCRLVVTSNPSTVLKLLETRARYESWLLEDLAASTIANRFGLPDDVLAAIDTRLGRRRGQAAVAAFPDLRAVICWRSGPSAFFARKVAERLPARVRFFDLGYLASDSPLTWRLGPDGEQICAFDRLFFEFVPVDDAAGSDPPVLYRDIEEGRLYRIVITNDHGLYRYDIGDVVRMTRRFGQAPMIEFVRKVEGFSNMTGEKLSEDQAIGAVEQACRDCRLALTFFALSPDFESCAYRLHVESEYATPATLEVLGRQVDEALKRANVEYRSKRDSSRLGPIVPRQVSLGTFDHCRQELVARGRREAQLKIPHLIVDEGLCALLERRVAA